MDKLNLSFKISPEINGKSLNKLFSDCWSVYLDRDFSYLKRSLFYVCCYDETGELIGFVNVIGDGFLHAYILDTTVSPKYRKQGIGTELVRTAVEEAKKRGLEWIHVDYESDLENFYVKCGFRKTNAGIMNLKNNL